MANDFPLDVDALLRVLNYLNIGVYITDLDRRMILWNRKAEEITGHKAADVVGKHCRDNVLCHVDKYGNLLCLTHLCPLLRAIQTGSESKQPVLVFGQKAGGGRVALSTSVAPLRDESGAVIGGIETFRDETENIRDLEFAQKIQRHIMPEKLPKTDKIVFDARYYPHDLVGGDFYDVDDLGGGKYAVFVADVRGHGVSASLYTTVLKTIKDSLMGVAADPSAFLSAVNRELSRLVVSESFATAAYAVIDTGSWEVAYASAGQPEALHYQAASRQVFPVETFGLPLGIDASETYESGSLYLMPGDILFYYTDGLTDIRVAGGKALSTEGLGQLLREEVSRGSEGLLERIYGGAVAMNTEVAINDDVLMVSVERKD